MSFVKVAASKTTICSFRTQVFYVSRLNYSSAKKHTAKLHRLSLHNDFPICENNSPCNAFNLAIDITNLICTIKAHTTKIHPNHSHLNSSLISLYYSCTISVNISYARATLSLAEISHLRKMKKVQGCLCLLP